MKIRTRKRKRKSRKLKLKNIKIKNIKLKRGRGFWDNLQKGINNAYGYSGFY